jgi:hypothetical protein
MHDEDSGLVNWFLPTKREILRSDIFFIGDFTDKAYNGRVLRLDYAGNSSTARQLLTLLKC